MSAEWESNRAKIQANIQDGSEAGYGIIYVESKAGPVCLVIKNNEKGHRHLLFESFERISSEAGVTATLAKPSLEDAYKSLQRTDCKAVYASGVDIKTLISAMKSDGANPIYSGIWNSDSEIEKAEKLVKDKEDAEARKKVEAQRRSQSQADLKKELDAAEKATARKRQESLQQQFGKIAAAASAAIAKDLRDATDKTGNWQEGAAYAQFPKFVAWYQNMIRSRWELQSFNSEIFDYGRADWKGRSMETALVRVSIRLRNKILGEYQDGCFVFGRMNDTEFSMVRDPVEANCDQTSGLQAWSKTRQMQSQWLAQP